MSETFFLQVASTNSSGDSLHLTHVLTSFLPIEEAIERFYKKSLEVYRYTYSAGHYGEEAHLWEFSHHEAYQPVDSTLPAMVILRYCPVDDNPTLDECQSS